MERPSHFRIEILYLRVGEETPLRVTLTPQSYWEPDDFSLDSVPIFDHAADYLDEPVSRLRRTELLVADEHKGDRHLVVESFWDGGRSRIVEVQDTRQHHWEIIVDVAAGESGIERDIVRYGQVGSRRAPFFHTRYTAVVGGGEREQVVYSLQADSALTRMLADEEVPRWVRTASSAGKHARVPERTDAEPPAYPRSTTVKDTESILARLNAWSTDKSSPNPSRSCARSPPRQHLPDP